MADSKDYVTRELENGTLNINEDVVATIASTAVKDVDGVIGLNGSLGDDLVGMLGRKSGSKGIRILLDDDNVEVECNLIVLYGHSVVEIAKNVQNGVSAAIESMTGLHVRNVDVNICGISMTKA